MNKTITLELDKENNYTGYCKLDREFFRQIRDFGYINLASSLEDLPETIDARFYVEKRDLSLKKRRITVQIFTEICVPDKWNTEVLKWMNKELISDDAKFIMTFLNLGRECIVINEGEKYITIDIPL